MVMGDIPHYYIYYLGNPSEAMLAKRRSHASLISYMPPPFVRSGLYGELSELEGLIAEYRESSIADVGRSENVLEMITEKAEAMRLPTDIDDLEHELEDENPVGQFNTRFIIQNEIPYMDHGIQRDHCQISPYLPEALPIPVHDQHHDSCAEKHAVNGKKLHRRQICTWLLEFIVIHPEYPQ